jgi:hypothetical protein
MAPMMWEKLKMNLSTASPRSIATLLHPCSDILSHVRDLNIYGTKEGEDYLRLVIAAIPRDRVRTFWTHFSPETLTLHLLLLSQRKIEDLAIFRCFITSGHPRPSDLDSEEHHEWMGSSLPEVSSIHLGIGPNEASDEDAFYDMKFVSRCCPKMTCLSLFKNLGPASEGFLHSVSSVFKFSLAEEAPLFQNLTCLRLFDLDIATPEDQPLCKNFNLSKLRSLQIKECDYLIPFLDGLSSFYIDCTGQLDELIILLPEGLDQPLETIQAMERLLKNCPKLQSLDMDFEGYGPIAKDCILAHCQTLISLQISFGVDEWKNTFSEYMTSILRACTKLNRLAIDMPTLNAHTHDIPGFKAGSSFPADFADMLASFHSPF